MSKQPKVQYLCKNCNYSSPKWLGKCPECGAWNSFEKTEAYSQSKNSNGKVLNLPPTQTLKEIQALAQKSPKPIRLKFKQTVLNNFWSGGITYGGVTLLAGEPGLGKSTLAMQITGSVSLQNPEAKILYISGEEEVLQIADRAKRLRLPDNIKMVNTNLLESVEKILATEKFDLLILDSIQTFRSLDLDSNFGSISQILEVMDRLITLAKRNHTALIIIGHVTKEGQIAGPKTLEHMVDTVLLLESSKNNNYRTLSFSKNRYGSSENLLLLQMKEAGLEIVTNPSLAMLENIETSYGVSYSLVFEKNLPLLVEVQALVTEAREGNWFGRRESVNYSSSKLNTIIAILEKYLNLDLRSRDIYIQLSGVNKKTSDPNLDLAIALAIYSSIFKQTIKQIFHLDETLKPIFAGRLTLSGNLRKPIKLVEREKTAKDLKFQLNPKITYDSLSKLFLTL